LTKEETSLKIEAWLNPTILLGIMEEGMSKQIMAIKGLTSEVENKQILKGINLTINEGEVHVIMGPNGAGKSTLANVLMGHPSHSATGGEVEFVGKDLFDMKVDERARAGLFMSFQYPEEVPGVTVVNFLRTAKGQITGEMPSQFELNSDIYENLEDLNMSDAYLQRYLNQGFSGGEKKKNEILQMAVLEPKLAILDETDSGLDVDAIKDVYEKIQKLAKKDNAIVVITHYNKILNYIKPDFVHILVDGKIVKSGDLSLADTIEREGYDVFKGVN
jgi:Fe-S cluster assembly ATP-binding protein